jgi:hypothetical protein
MLPWEEGGTGSDKLNSLAWRKPYAEPFSEIGSERLLTTLAGMEIEVFQRLWGFVAGQDASGLFCSQVAPRYSVRSRSTQIGEYRVF